MKTTEPKKTQEEIIEEVLKDNPKIKDFFLGFERFMDLLDVVINKIDDTERFKESINANKWDYLMFYYLDPLICEYNALSESYFNIVEEG